MDRIRGLQRAGGRNTYLFDSDDRLFLEIIMLPVNFHNHCLWGMLSEELKMWFENIFLKEAREKFKELKKVLEGEVSKVMLH